MSWRDRQRLRKVNVPRQARRPTPARAAPGLADGAAPPPASTARKRGPRASKDVDGQLLSDRMDRAQRPGRITFGLMFLIVPAPWVWPRAFIEPTDIVGPMRPAVPWLVGITVFTAASTLTTLAYCHLWSPGSTVNKP